MSQIYYLGRSGNESLLQEIKRTLGLTHLSNPRNIGIS